MDDTRTTLFSKFREEVDTHLLRLQQGVIALEQDPANPALLKETFRAAHTVKGAAKMMGFAEIVRVTHELESVLGAVRDGQLQLSPDSSDLLFEAIDAINVLTQLQADPHDVAAGQARAELDLDGLVARLKAIAGVPPAPAAGPANAGGMNGAAPADGRGDAGAAVSLTAGAGVAAIARPDAAPARADLPGLKLGEDSVRVRVQKLDSLMHLSGELIITKMQHQLIGGRMQALLELERSRARQLAELLQTVQRSWGAINQADMEDALNQLVGYGREVDDHTLSTLREFQDYANRLNTVANELEDTVLSVRMLPVETLFSTFPRAIRDFKRETGKEVDLVIRGGETELDKQILEALADPLIHLLRNALDHGIEPPREREAAGKPAVGRVGVYAYQQGTQVVIEVVDDGAGIDPARLRRVALQKGFLDRLEAEKLTDADTLGLIFRPGFSTASIITDVSGRGVGMDVVKSTVEARLNGTVDVESTPGTGTRVVLRLPLTLATMKALLVRVGSQVFVLPSHTIEAGMDYIGPEDILLLGQHEMVRPQGRLVPLIRLADLLDLGRVDSGAWLREAGLPAGRVPRSAWPDDAGPSLDDDDSLDAEIAAAFQTPALGTGVRLLNKLPGVVVGSGDRQVCFLVDELIDESDVVVKSLGPVLGKVDTVMGATVLGDGRVVVILDVPSLLAVARARAARGGVSRAWEPTVPSRVPCILVVDDSITTRELEKSILENAGYAVDIAMDGQEALVRLEAEQARGHTYDLAIVDIEMPHMDGIELTQRIKTHPESPLRALPVIIVSSLASEAYKQRAVEVGAQAYITKGQFDQSNLLRTIDLLIH